MLLPLSSFLQFKTVHYFLCDCFVNYLKSPDCPCSIELTTQSSDYEVPLFAQALVFVILFLWRFSSDGVPNSFGSIDDNFLGIGTVVG
jgi:hypothetical protein